jgi:phosphatidylethanolamine/phosphatidyl-N-methylethanolamine N-methyltransferase
MRQRLADYRVFWRQFRQAYNSTGALLPSGRVLSRALARFVRDGEAALAAGENGRTTSANHPEKPRRILEVGPGTGAVTIEIAAGMRPDDQLVMVERNEQFVEHLAKWLREFPAVQVARDRISLVHASVEDLPENEPYDVIISGLPLNNFTVDTVDRILAKLSRLLAPGGTLSFFEYVAIRKAKSLVCSREDRERLQGISRVLGEYLRSEVRRDLVMANVPPAWVHHVQRVPVEARP